ncbi:hypothetical protein AVEN_220610-1 [Araneus ventricosus]|uniref:Uncharacterized protein n=1 Tax=Araneus ventricosus TaxID=182803 RepID=A0A4Y2GMT4_ARAVE|nr:hypothetical protein AVEN_220610-1 [Araneus ventricosus]
MVETLIGKKRPRDDDFILTFPGIVPYAKRAAVDKSGLPVYQPTGAAYQQALAMQVQQPFVPVTSVDKFLSLHTSEMYCVTFGTEVGMGTKREKFKANVLFPPFCKEKIHVLLSKDWLLQNC